MAAYFGENGTWILLELVWKSRCHSGAKPVKLHCSKARGKAPCAKTCLRGPRSCLPFSMFHIYVMAMIEWGFLSHIKFKSQDALPCFLIGWLDTQAAFKSKSSIAEATLHSKMVEDPIMTQAKIIQIIQMQPIWIMTKTRLLALAAVIVLCCPSVPRHCPARSDRPKVWVWCSTSGSVVNSS